MLKKIKNCDQLIKYYYLLIQLWFGNIDIFGYLYIILCYYEEANDCFVVVLNTDNILHRYKATAAP